MTVSTVSAPCSDEKFCAWTVSVAVHNDVAHSVTSRVFFSICQSLCD